MWPFTKKSAFWRDQLKGFVPLPAPSWDEALRLFDDVADMRNITFGYVSNGCYARAHLMCRYMVNKGYLPGKVWLFEDTEALRIQMPDKTEPTRWCFHVAPTLDVDMGPPHGVRPMVFDPALFDGPVSPERWCEIMGGIIDHLYLTALGHSAPGHWGDYIPFGKRFSPDAKDFTSVHTDQLALEEMDKFRQFIISPVRNVFSCGRRAPTKGKTWQTHHQKKRELQPALNSYCR